MPYGPTFTAEGCDENVRLGMQFQGASKRPFFQRNEVQMGELDLREMGGTFDDKGLFVWPNGRKQDSAEAIREHLGGKPLEYPKARYDDYVVAWDEVLHETSTEWASWHVVPADRNWVKSTAVATLLVDTLERLDPKLPEPEPGVEGLVIE